MPVNMTAFTDDEMQAAVAAMPADHEDLRRRVTALAYELAETKAYHMQPRRAAAGASDRGRVSEPERINDQLA